VSKRYSLAAAALDTTITDLMGEIVQAGVDSSPRSLDHVNALRTHRPVAVEVYCQHHEAAAHGATTMGAIPGPLHRRPGPDAVGGTSIQTAVVAVRAPSE